MACNHYWREIESDPFGKPTKYKCVNCPLIYEVKQVNDHSDYLAKLFDKRNSINNRIAENEQKIRLIKLNSIGLNEKIHLNHLTTEIKVLETLC